MDFGLDRLLEMLEARFGRKVTDVVVAILGIALVVFALNHIWNEGIEPLRNALGDASKGHVDWGEVAARFGLTIASAILGVAIVYIGGRVLSKRVERHARETVEMAAVAVEDYEKQGDAILTALTKMRDEAIILQREATRETKRAQDVKKEAQTIYGRTKRLLKEIEHKASSPPDETEA